MVIRADNLKITQALGFLLKLHDGFSTRLRLLKLLYIADRELLVETHRTITGDRAMAMVRGPVLERTHGMLKGNGAGTEVASPFIRRVNTQAHRLAHDPGVGKLSKREMRKLEDVANRYRDEDDQFLSDYTHEFEEWRKNWDPAAPNKHIPLCDLLAAVGLSEFEAEMRANARAEAELHTLLADAERLSVAELELAAR